ncbi:hypothetical protein BV22DRAFT_1135704 [Leucogyrophana mollusca]|uniref:Uncharacterized protein n=1 Tax=Leucogyrophana mollusca TaxID=85980 RepID=A0ACB8AWZ4_9AGAM|nr:hypothetical protein BV22DRAFT_1135704 [Leucogyrophana mollusca]
MSDPDDSTLESDSDDDFGGSLDLNHQLYHTFQDRDGERSFCRTIQGLLWVSLNASTLSDIPNEASAWRSKGPATIGPNTVTLSGLLVEMEWALKPDWYRRHSHWHAWLWPQSFYAGYWYHIIDRFLPDDSIVTLRPGWFGLSPNLYRQMKDDVCGIECAVQLIATLKHYPQNIPRPDVCRVWDVLKNGTDSITRLTAYVVQAQRVMQSNLAWIRWVTNSDFQLREGLTAKRFADVRDLLARHDWNTPGGRGVLVDLQRDWREINISLPVAANIPIYYPWDSSVSSVERFFALSPVALGSCDLDVWSGPPATHPDLSSPRPRIQPPVARTYYFDNFLQKIELGRAEVQKSRGQQPPLIVRVIDFEGWKSKEVEKALKPYYKRAFGYVEKQVSSGRNVLRIHRRFRPLSFLPDQDIPDGEPDVYYTWELFPSSASRT